MFKLRGMNLLCHYCRRKLLSTTAKNMDLRATRDHFNPRMSRKTVWCCYKCNQMKADLPTEIWLCYIFTHSGWWLLPTGRAIKWARREGHVP